MLVCATYLQDDRGGQGAGHRHEEGMEGVVHGSACQLDLHVLGQGGGPQTAEQSLPLVYKNLPFLQKGCVTRCAFVDLQ